MIGDFDLVAGPYGGVTDGPVWDGSGLIFSSVGESCIRRYDPRTREATVFRPHRMRIRGLAFDAAGILYGCQSGSRRIVQFNADGSASPIRARLDGELHNCPDDVAIDRRGRIWFSDPYDPVPPRGPDIRPFLDHQSVLRLNPVADGEWRLARMTHDTRSPRGVLLSPDQRTLYVADSEDDPTGAHEIRGYPIRDDGTLGDGQLLHRFGSDVRGVDGLCLDTEGRILACVAAAEEPGGIAVISPRGEVLDHQPLPDGQPTNCAYGDDMLYVTTAGGHLYRAATRSGG